ncbi:uncharacterized protein LOC141679690 [Apium graveolens]|uniref:uncharacterized protein LOC141679690 n=1 Tax=Apium graveolens TaxID=4045 RepID=UPI003D7AAF3E
MSMPSSNEVKADMWDTCNHMVIAWITHNVSPLIKIFVIYMTSVHAICKNLETRFALINRSRKYRLNKDLYDVRQNMSSVNDYYTSMKSLWVELDTLNVLQTVTGPTTEVVKLLEAIENQKEESRLFQFLNGIDEMYAAQRSQLLLSNPLSYVETAAAALMQEEAQMELLLKPTGDTEVMAMYSKSQTVKGPP